MTQTSKPLPTWDMSGLVIGVDPEGLGQAGITISAAVDALAAQFADQAVGTSTPSPRPDVAVVEDLLDAVNTTFRLADHAEQILDCLASADTTDAAVQRAASQVRVQRGRLDDMEARFNRWLSGLDLDDLAAQSPMITAHLYPLRQRQRLAQHQMPPAAEEVASALGSVGGHAWAKLRDDLEASLVGQVEIDGVVQDVSAGEFHALLAQPDRDLRRRAHEAQLAATAPLAGPLAAAINAVKGETLLLTQRRGWADPLDPMLTANGIDRETLEVLLGAVRAAQPLYWRYLRAQATALGLTQLTVYDLSAPISTDRSWNFAEAAQFVTDQFASASAALGAVAERAVQERWIDVYPRPGKVDGAFCSPVGKGQSRILLNFAPSYLGMSTLAHELGHAYHVAILAERQRTWLQVSPPPMTLVETASTLCEVLVQRAARRNASPADERAILGGWLQTAADTVFGVLRLYDLEQAIFALRRDHELSLDEFNDLAVSNQTASFGDTVAPEATSYEWSIWHLGQPDIWHYTFSYIFGLLFGLGLYAEFQREPERFFARLDGLLADINLEDANTLAGRFGIDLRDPAFWQEGLSLLEADIARFETLAASGGGTSFRV